MKRNTISFLVIVVMTLLTVSWGYSQETTPPPTPPVEQPTPAPEPVPEAVPVEEVVPMEEAVAEEMEAPAPSKGLRVGGGLGIGLMSSVANADEADNGMPIGGGIELSLAKYIPQLKNASLFVGFGVATKKVTYKTHKEKETSHTEISALLKFGLPANLPNNMKAFACAGGVLSTADDEKANDKILQFGAGVEYPVNAKLSATATALYSMGLDNQLWMHGGDGTRSGLGLSIGVLYAL